MFEGLIDKLMPFLDAGREGLNLPWKLSREDEPVKEKLHSIYLNMTNLKLMIFFTFCFLLRSLK